MSKLTNAVDIIRQKIDDELCVLSPEDQKSVLDEIALEIENRQEGLKTDLEGVESTGD